MKYNTTSFTNPDMELFIGKYDGEEYKILTGEKRFFPTFISEHFANQLLDRILRQALRRNKRLDKDEFIKEKRSEILGKEMKTAKPETPKTMKDEVLEHESRVKDMLASQEKKRKANEIEAFKILKRIEPTKTEEKENV